MIHLNTDIVRGREAYAISRCDLAAVTFFNQGPLPGMDKLVPIMAVTADGNDFITRAGQY